MKFFDSKDRLGAFAGSVGRSERSSSPHGRQMWMIKLKAAAAVLLATLREIFDEAAYSRFLRSHQLSSSRRAYAAFRREYGEIKARRPRCC